MISVLENSLYNMDLYPDGLYFVKKMIMSKLHIYSVQHTSPLKHG